MIVDYPAAVVQVVDGDTIKVHVAGWPAVIDPIDVRVVGVDAPEHVRPPAKSACEVKLGLAASAFARTVTQPGDAVVLHYTIGKRDKYMRVLGSISLPDGRDFATVMIAAHQVRPYSGGAKTPWCAKGKPLP